MHYKQTIDEKKNMALATFTKAEATGDWEEAARQLKAAFVPKPKNPNARPFRAGKCVYPYPLAVATFVDDIEVTMNFWSQTGMVLDWRRAKSICESVYRSYIGDGPAAEMISLIEHNTSEKFDLKGATK